jgi:hypothetical protein
MMIGKVVLGKEYDMMKFQMSGKVVEGIVLDKIQAPMRYNFKAKQSIGLTQIQSVVPEVSFEFIPTDFYIIKPHDGEEGIVKYVPCQFVERIIK